MTINLMFGVYRDEDIQKGLDEITRLYEWKIRALADGWIEEPTYESESITRAARLKHPEGFRALMLTRDDREPKSGAPRIEASLSIWGPDGLSIKPPREYSMEDLRAGLSRCHSCGAENVATQRYSFAGRCCAACLPEMRKQHEQPGWCD